jgi:hypothetical protein
MKTETVTTMDYNELEDLVKKHMGFDYESVADNEWNNYSCYDTETTRKDAQDDYFKKYDLPELKKRMKGKGNESISFHVIITWLVWKKILPEGKYIIDVSW